MQTNLFCPGTLHEKIINQEIVSGATDCAQVECFAAYLEILTKGEEGEGGRGVPILGEGGPEGAGEAPQGVLAWKQLHWPHTSFRRMEIIISMHKSCLE